MTISLGMDREEAEARVILNQVMLTKTQIPFLMDHCGLRDGCIHLLLATTGAGKSTMVRTIMYDYLRNNYKKILVWLSEESVESLKTQCSYIAKISNTPLHNIEAFSEVDHQGMLKDMNQEAVRKSLLQTFKSYASKDEFGIIILDNITTSSLYTNFEGQEKTAREIKTMVSGIKKPLVCVAHTEKSKRNKMLSFDPNSIRGSGTIVNLAEYLYVLQSISVNGSRKSFISIEKSRAHTIKNKLYAIGYNDKLKIFDEIAACNYELFKKTVKNMDEV